MSRTLTLLALMLVAGVSYGLYQLSYEVQKLESRLSEMNRALVQERENIEVLNAEWAYLNRPDVLQARVERHLDMAVIKAKQIVGLAELPNPGARPVVPAVVAPKAAAKTEGAKR